MKSPDIVCVIPWRRSGTSAAGHDVQARDGDPARDHAAGRDFELDCRAPENKSTRKVVSVEQHTLSSRVRLPHYANTITHGFFVIKYK